MFYPFVSFNRLFCACNFLSLSCLIAMFREVLTSIGIRIDGEGLHNLRHTFVSNAIRRGVSAKRIQVWVGHKSITKTMDTYGHLFPDDFEEMTTMIDMGSWEDTEQTDKVEIA